MTFLNFLQKHCFPFRYDWYQTEMDVVVNVLLKNVKQDQCNVNFNEHNLSVTIKLDTGNDYSLEIDLAHPIVPSKSVCRVLGTKVSFLIIFVKWKFITFPF